MGITIKAGQIYVLATPSSQNSQVLRARAAADYTTYTINANASGSTKYDWIYASVSATNANNPAADASNVTSIVTSRSSSNTTDNGTPPTYGLLLAIVTVANAASSITNANITDKRVAAVIGPTSNATLASLFDYVDSGCVWSGDSYASTLAASMTSGVVRIGGAILTVNAVSGRAFTASKDTYVDLKNNGDGTAVPVYTEVANNAASPALVAGQMRIGIIQSGATITAVGAVNQGQETKVLPIASSIPYAVTDSLGNLICPRDPARKILGYRQIITSYTLSSSQTTPTQITGLSCPVIVPTGRKVKITVQGNDMTIATTNQRVTLAIWDGVVNSGTQLNISDPDHPTNANPMVAFVQALTTPAATSKTYNAGISGGSANNVVFNAGSTSPGFIMVELV